MGLSVVSGVALIGVWGLAVPVDAASTALFSSAAPGFQANAVTVPAGICFVTITADGGHGGAGSGGAGGAAPMW